jgi:hypothetical protein
MQKIQKKFFSTPINYIVRMQSCCNRLGTQPLSLSPPADGSHDSTNYRTGDRSQDTAKTGEYRKKQQATDVVVFQDTERRKQ